MRQNEGDMTTAIYARFSSDLQTEKSIEDQVARCREVAAGYGSGLCRVFCDHALSGASTANRPGLKELLAEIAASRISILITESLDRLSRDQADLALIYRATKMHSVRLITASEGEVMAGSQGILQIGMRGMIGAMYLADLADKTRRGLMGVATSGRIPGGLSYGYRAIEGEVRGLRAIIPEEADIVRHIFERYAAGHSPRAIAKALNAAGTPGPRGGTWGVSVIMGNPKRLNGILCNPLYRGELVFNRQHKVKNPETGKARMVPNPESLWRRFEMPDMRIIEDALWNAVQARRDVAGKTRPEHHRRPKRVLSGLIKCGMCGGSYRAIAQGPRYGCANHRDRGTCDNSRSIMARDLEARVFEGLTANLLSPSSVEYAVACYRERMNELEGDKAKGRAKLERDISKHRQTVKMAQDQVRSGTMPPQWLYDAATESEGALKALEIQLANMDDPCIVKMHPGASKKYRRLIEDLNAALSTDDGQPARVEAVEAMRKLISSIIVSPAKVSGVTIDVEGDLAALLGIQKGGPIVGALGAGTGFVRNYNIVPFRFAAR